MFVRASAWWNDHLPDTPDERFLHGEAYAAFWAAAVLSEAPIINRPNRQGTVGRMTWGAIACALNFDSAEMDREIHSSRPDVIGSADDAMWGEDADFRIAPVAELRRGTPLRARRINTAAVYEIVTVVGHRGFLATTEFRSTDLDLIRRSVSLVQQVGTHFATVTWAIGEEGAAPVRLNAAPPQQELCTLGTISPTLCAGT